MNKQEEQNLLDAQRAATGLYEKTGDVWYLNLRNDIADIFAKEGINSGLDVETFQRGVEMFSKWSEKTFGPGHDGLD